jgi:hypothetical protein
MVFIATGHCDGTQTVMEQIGVLPFLSASITHVFVTAPTTICIAIILIK